MPAAEPVVEEAPEGVEVTLSAGPGQQGASLGTWISVPGARAFLTVREDGARGSSGPHEILLRIRAGTELIPHFVQLDLFPAPCGSPSPLMCPGG